MTRLGLIVFAVGSLLLSGRASAMPVDLIDEDFNAVNSGVGAVDFSGFGGTPFSVTEGSVDLFGNGFVDFFPANELHVHLDGQGSLGVSRFETGALVLPPGDYKLTFDIAGSQSPEDPMGPNTPDSATLIFNGFAPEVFTLADDAPFQTITRDYFIGAPTTGTLAFIEFDGANQEGLLLDNVRLQHQAIPEPATAALVMLGASCLLLRRKRVRRPLA